MFFGCGFFWVVIGESFFFEIYVMRGIGVILVMGEFFFVFMNNFFSFFESFGFL